MPHRRYSENIVRILDFSLPTALMIWLIIPISKIPMAVFSSVPVFFLFLIVRSYEIYLRKISLNRFKGGFWHYLLRRNALLQNIILALLLGSSGFILVSFTNVIRMAGGFRLIGSLDLVLLVLVLALFFYRPGIKRTLSRSVQAVDENSLHLDQLAARFGMKSPELRIIPSRGPGHANAFSWSLPGGKSYVFANEDLFSALNWEEIGGIFTHELGHIRSRHSEKSFLLSVLVPLLWLNYLLLPLALLPVYISAVTVSSAMGAAIAYFHFGRGTVSRRFEKQADLFAARNYDRDIYLSSLKKLALSAGTYNSRENGNYVSHDSLEERERLIRGA